MLWQRLQSTAIRRTASDRIRLARFFQHQEPAIIDDTTQIAHALARVPTNPFIAHRDSPGRAGKLNAAQHGSLRQMGIDQVAQVRSKRHCMPKVGIPAHQLAEKPAGLPCLDSFHLQPAQIARCSADRPPRFAALGHWHLGPPAHRTARALFRQDHQTAPI
jgi:hypothetical protein